MCVVASSQHCVTAGILVCWAIVCAVQSLARNTKFNVKDRGTAVTCVMPPGWLHIVTNDFSSLMWAQEP